MTSEQAVIGCVLLDPFCIDKAMSLKCSDFSDVKHRKIWKEIVKLHEDGKKPDIIILAERTNEPMYLAELVEEMPTASHIDQYVSEVKKERTKRNYIDELSRRSASISTSEDVVDEIGSAVESFKAILENGVETGFLTMEQGLKELGERIRKVRESGHMPGISTGFADLNDIIYGLHDSDLLILAARPSMGKTSLGLNIALNVTKHAKNVGFFSLEMSKDQIIERLMSMVSGVDTWKIRTAKMNAEEIKCMGAAAKELKGSSLFIDDSAGLSIYDLRARVLKLDAEEGLDLIVVDYLQLLGAGKAYRGNRVAEVSEISRQLKILAKDLNIPILAMSQLSRSLENRDDKHPRLSDLRESGSIEQDADIVMFMYSEEYYDKDNRTDEPITEINIAKNRHGKVGSCNLRFIKNRVMFDDMDGIEDKTVYESHIS